jgi:hypothetical protein
MHHDGPPANICRGRAAAHWSRHSREAVKPQMAAEGRTDCNAKRLSYQLQLL